MKKTQEIHYIRGRAVPYLEDNVDTDRIAPTEEALYALSWPELTDVFCIKERLNPGCILNDKMYEGANILFTGRNFGCGSSREHATQGTKARYDAVVGLSFAPIFEDNAYAIGLPVVKIDERHLEGLLEVVRACSETEFVIDLRRRKISWGSSFAGIEIEESKRKGFLQGTWDEREALAANLPRTKEVLDRIVSIRGY